MIRTITPKDMQATAKVRAFADCPYCGFTGEITDGWYDNQWNGGRGGYRVTCPSCDKPYAIEQDAANELQHLGLVLLGE